MADRIKELEKDFIAETIERGDVVGRLAEANERIEELEKELSLYKVTLVESRWIEALEKVVEEGRAHTGFCDQDDCALCAAYTELDKSDD